MLLQCTSDSTQHSLHKNYLAQNVNSAKAENFDLVQSFHCKSEETETLSQPNPGVKWADEKPGPDSPLLQPHGGH